MPNIECNKEKNSFRKKSYRKREENFTHKTLTINKKQHQPSSKHQTIQKQNYSPPKEHLDFGVFGLLEKKGHKNTFGLTDCIKVHHAKGFYKI